MTSNFDDSAVCEVCNAEFADIEQASEHIEDEHPGVRTETNIRLKSEVNHE